MEQKRLNERLYVEIHLMRRHSSGVPRTTHFRDFLPDLLFTDFCTSERYALRFASSIMGLHWRISPSDFRLCIL